MKKCLARIVACVFVLGAVSCAKPERVRIPVVNDQCKRTVLAHNADGFKTRRLEADTWFSLILSNYEAGRKRTSGRPRHCNGDIVAVAPFPVALNCEEGPLLGRRVVRDSDRLSMQRLVRQPLSENEELVWLQTHVDDQDDALGPLVKVKWGKRSVTAEPMGTLAAHRNGAQLNVVAGKEPLLAVESDRCQQRRGGKCVRELRVRVLRRGEFRNLPMVGDYHRCAGEFAIKLEEGRRVQRRKELAERYEVTRTFQDLAPDGVSIVEVSSVKRFAGKGSMTAVEPETSSLRRRVEVRDDHVYVEPGVMEELAVRFPVRRQGGKSGKRRLAR